jgi:hypothetical protein
MAENVQVTAGRDETANTKLRRGEGALISRESRSKLITAPDAFKETTL